MKFTQILLKQHLGRHFKKHWWIQGRKVPIETGAHVVLSEKGIPVYEPQDILKERRFEKVEIVGLKPKSIAFDETHPDWHERVCLTYNDENVLLEGFKQAQILTKTVEIQQGLPEKIQLDETNGELDNKVKDIILSSHLFDAEQQKLPKLKDPLRPAWNFPRIYGITDVRINKLINLRLLQLVELNSNVNLVRQRMVLNDLCFSYPFEKNENLIQFQVRGDVLLTASKPLERISSHDTKLLELPDISPIKETITLVPDHFNKIRNLYPIHTNVIKSHPHTLFIHYNNNEVKNLFEEEVTDEQIFGHSLLKSFTVAASYAKQRYGENVKIIPTPVTLQCVLTNGRFFHFGILQLNTLDLEDGAGIKNIWYQTSKIPLLTTCAYVSGKPTLEGYNNEVIKHLIAFYHNI